MYKFFILVNEVIGSMCWLLILYREVNVKIEIEKKGYQVKIIEKNMVVGASITMIRYFSKQKKK